MKIFLSAVLALIFSMLPTSTHAAPPSSVGKSTPSFADFDRRARAGERLSVVFFGASLTWGANASDPQLTSYRAQMARRFEAAYPNAHFTFWDAAIGGTRSQLGVFRFERDVLSRQPDLILLDFTLNDDLTGTDEEVLASYESLVRRAIIEANCPIELVFFPGAREIRRPDIALPRVEAHRQIARAYNAATGDAIALMRQRVQDGAVTVEQLWPLKTDQTHPGDKGYALYAEAAWNGFQAAVAQKQVCRAPAQMLHAPTYMTQTRARISSLGPPPQGWNVGRPNRISAWYDALMSRWLDDEVVASNRREAINDQGKTLLVPQEVAPLRLRFHGSMALLFGEATVKSGQYRVVLDGQPIHSNDTPQGDFNASSANVGGNVHHVRVLATNLDPTIEHTLEIVPQFAPDAERELRLESVCVAGGENPRVSLAP